jgi:DNA-binding CsgD family transcriptional regulator
MWHRRQQVDLVSPDDRPPRPDFLTRRERAVLARVVDGDTSKEIARELGISPRTVEFHRANIMKKFGAKNLADLVREFLRASHGIDSDGTVV